MHSCAEVLSRIPVSWEELPEAPVARGRMWARVAERVRQWVRGGGRLLLLVGEWGSGKSSVARLIQEEAARVGVGFAYVLARSMTAGGRGWDSKERPDIVFVDQVEDVVLGEGVAVFLDFLSSALATDEGGIRVVAALTPAAFERLKAELLWRERLGWLVRRATVIELPRLSKDELLGVVEEALARLGLSLGDVLERRAAPLLYHASAGNPGVALKVLRDSGITRCPASAAEMLRAVSRVIVPAPAGEVPAVEPRVLDVVEEAASACGDEAYILAAGGAVKARPGLEECLARHGVQVARGSMYLVAPENVAEALAALAEECRRLGCREDDAYAQLYPLEEGWGLHATGPAGEAVERVGRRYGVDLGSWLAPSGALLARLYPRLSTPPLSFIPDPPVAASVDAAARRALAEGRAGELVRRGVLLALEAIGVHANGRLVINHEGARYRVPITVVYEPEDHGEECSIGVYLVITPEDSEPGKLPCPWARRVALPYRALRVLAAAGYAAQAGVEIDEDAARDVLASLASEHGLVEAVVDSFRALVEEGLVAPPHPPIPLRGDAREAGRAAAAIYLMVEAVGIDGVRGAWEEALRLAVPAAERLCGVSWGPLTLARLLGFDSLLDAARAVVEAIDWDRVKRALALGGRVLRAEGRPGREAAEFVEGAIEALASPPQPLRAAPRAAVARAEAAALRLAGVAGVGRDVARLAVHTIVPLDGAPVVVRPALEVEKVEALRAPRVQAGPPAQAWAWAVSGLERIVEWHADHALQAISYLERSRKQRPPPLTAPDAFRLSLEIGLAHSVAEAVAAAVEGALKRLDPAAVGREALRRAFERLGGLLEKPPSVNPGECRPEEMNLLVIAYREEVRRIGRLAGEARSKLAVLRDALQAAAEAARRLRSMGLEGAVKARISDIVSGYGDVKSLDDAIRLANAVRATLETLLRGATLLVKLREEVERKASRARREAAAALEEAGKARSAASQARREGEAALEAGPAVEAAAREYIAAADAVEAAAEAVEAAARGALEAAENALRAVEAAGLGLAERLALRLGEALERLGQARSRLGAELSRLNDARERLAAAIASEAESVARAAARIARAASAAGSEEAASAAARAEVAALAARDEVAEGRLARAASLLAQAVDILATARTALASVLGDIEARVYAVLESGAGGDLESLAAAARVGLREAALALARLAELGLVKVRVEPV